MAIQNLPEFAKNGQKNTDGLVLLDGFPVNKKPARQWMNFLFNQLTVAINAVNAEKLDATSNAVSASKWQTARTTSFSGAATGSFSTDGSKDSSCVLTLANSGVTAGTFGSNTESAVLTIDAKGLVKVAKNQTIRSASTTQTGIVQLVDALNDTSETKALTAAQGKILNDRLNNAGVFTKAPTFTGTDLLVDVPDVCQTFTLSGTYTNAPPVFGNGSITGMIDVKKRWFEAGVQKILTIRHLSGQIWENVKNGETWGGWKRIDAIDSISTAIRIPKDADLNTYLDEGFFFCPSNVDTQTIKNKPVRNHAFSLHVEKNAVSTQTLKYYITTNFPKVEVWVRSKFEAIVNGGVWGEWEKLSYTSDDITGNAATATKLQTPLMINGKKVDEGGELKISGVRVGQISWHLGKRSKIRVGELALDGHVYKRVDYPELWKLIESDFFATVTDAAWLSNKNLRGSFTKGNGSTTFRVADLNGAQAGSIPNLFIRGAVDDIGCGAVEDDAIRDIVGEFGLHKKTAELVSGVFEYTNTIDEGIAQQGISQNGVRFRASRVVPTAHENRPKSVYGVWVITAKADFIEDLPTGVKPAVLVGGNDFGGSQNINGPLNVNGSFTQNGVEYVSGLGVGQEYRDVTSQRFSNVEYRNNLNKPILLIIQIQGNNAKVDIFINNLLIVGSWRSNSYGDSCEITVIVPSRNSYKFVGNMARFVELS